MRDVNDQLHSYVDAARQVTEASRRLRAIQMSEHNPERYREELGSALLEYHHHKMEEINQLISQHWKAIYFGMDIETIAIKTEMGISRGEHNCRVVMTRDGVELDMAKRCSAGQKLLFQELPLRRPDWINAGANNQTRDVETRRWCRESLRQLSFDI
jgi:DNA repair exonuclease SbcCD ATPase subunit